MLPHQRKIWVLVSDGARAKFYRYSAHQLEPALDYELIMDHRPSYEGARDKPGRGLKADHVSRHTFDPPTDWHEHQKEKMAMRLGELLEKESQKQTFDELIMIAPPKFMGLLRLHLSQAVQDKVTTHITKDLTHLNEKELKKHVFQRP
jgi:protein required for attachment to host cells